MQRVLKGNRDIAEVTSINVHISYGSTTRTVWNAHHYIYSDLDLEYEIQIAFEIVTLRCQSLGNLADPRLWSMIAFYASQSVTPPEKSLFTTANPQVITRLRAVVENHLYKVARISLTHKVKWTAMDA